MSDTFTETTSRLWFSRVAGSFLGVLFGILLVLAMMVLLFWNEGRAVQTARSLAEGAGAVIAVGSDRIDPANEGRLVHAGGTVATEETLRDPDFGVEARAVDLIRRAEMYQWIEDKKSETKTKLGGGEETVTTYSYRKGWADEAIDSSEFRKPDGHANPEMRWKDMSFPLDTAQMGAWTLDVQTLSRIGGAKPLPIPASEADKIGDTFGWAEASVSGGRIYIGQDPAAPQLGDQRIGYEVVPLGDISVVARQQGDGFAPYQTSAGDALFMVERGKVPAAQMFADAVSANKVVTWILRAVGLVLLMTAFALILGPAGTIADVVPFLGSLVRMGTGLIAFVLALVLGTTVIAFAWFWYRPLLALGILAAGFGIAWLVARLGGRGAPAPANPQPAA